MRINCATLGSVTAESTTKTISKATDKTFGIAGDWAAKEIAEGGSKEIYSAFARELTKNLAKKSGKIISEGEREIGSLVGKLIFELTSLGFTLIEAEEHIKHTKEEVDHKEGCKVCEA